VRFDDLTAGEQFRRCLPLHYAIFFHFYFSYFSQVFTPLDSAYSICFYGFLWVGLETERLSRIESSVACLRTLETVWEHGWPHESRCALVGSSLQCDGVTGTLQSRWIGHEESLFVFMPLQRVSGKAGLARSLAGFLGSGRSRFQPIGSPAG